MQLEKTAVGGKKGYVVASQFFKRKDDIRDEVRKILYGYLFDQPISESHLEFMLALLTFHKHAPQKVGAGVVSMVVRENPEFPGKRGFWIIRKDGTETDFSFMECIYPTDKWRDLLAALRTEVVDQILEAKREAFAATQVRICPITQDEITWQNCHVDHIPPQTFKALAEQFVKLYEVDVPTLEYIGGDGRIGERLADRVLSERWSKFHKDNANLRIVSETANLSVIPRTSR